MEISFKDWYRYFASNQKHFSQLCFSQKSELSDAERTILKSALQQFQRGESSEGLHLLKSAREYNADYHQAIILFVKEEQKHACILARYMRQENIPLIGGHWTDDVFRMLRKYFGLTHTIVVLMTAEVVATVFYRALCNAGKSPTLKKICEQILLDEHMHLLFQAYTLRRLQYDRNGLSKTLLRTYQHVLMTGTTMVVWMNYHKVLKQGGYNLSRYATEMKEVYTNTLQTIDGKAYHVQLAIENKVLM